MIKIFQTNKEVIDYSGEISAPSLIATGLGLYSKMPLYKPFEVRTGLGKSYMDDKRLG